MSESLAESVAHALLDDIVDGRLAAGSLLPSEAELATSHGVSRLTVREAVRILRAQHIVRIRRGRGTEVTPAREWTSWEAVVRASAAAGPHGTADLAERLLEARRMIEVGAARLAAGTRTEDDLDELRDSLERMRSAAAAGDVDGVARADLDFHDTIMRATANVFVPLLFDAFGPLLAETRRQTSAVPEVQRHAIEMHARIVEALESGDQERARLAMEEHMEQTERDLRRHVLDAADGGARPVREEDVLAGLPEPRVVADEALAAAVAGGPRLVVLDDDPTGTQTVADLPVLTTWALDDVRWAFDQGTSGFFVLTNTRSLGPADARTRTREAAEACLRVARERGERVAIASRSDSTLRGHFPLETDEIAAALAAAGEEPDAVLVCPAYVDAGRITVDSVHWVRTHEGMVPVAESEFAADATFGFASSRLPEWVEEKTRGRVARGDVERITLTDIRIGGVELVEARLARVRGGRVVVVDAADDEDLRVVSAAALAAEARGARLVYRVGPSFVRSRTGQRARPPLDRDRVRALASREGAAPGGLVVVGSHTALTTRQLDRLRRERTVGQVALDVASLPAAGGDPRGADAVLDALADETLRLLERGDVVLSTSRSVVRGRTGEESLGIARAVSAALVRVVRTVVERRVPAFVVAKGGITSSDTATEALGIRRAWVRGTLLPGIVSVWEPVAGPAVGLPYVVFAGNVGDDEGLATVVGKVSGS